jgi:hypothetical protein
MVSDRVRCFNWPRLEVSSRQAAPALVPARFFRAAPTHPAARRWGRKSETKWHAVVHDQGPGESGKLCSSWSMTALGTRTTPTIRICSEPTTRLFEQADSDAGWASSRRCSLLIGRWGRRYLEPGDRFHRLVRERAGRLVG